MCKKTIASMALVPLILISATTMGSEGMVALGPKVKNEIAKCKRPAMLERIDAFFDARIARTLRLKCNTERLYQENYRSYIDPQYLNGSIDDEVFRQALNATQKVLPGNQGNDQTSVELELNNSDFGTAKTDKEEFQIPTLQGHQSIQGQ